MTSKKQTETLQSNHYDRISHDYAEAYGDKYSREYRDQFINSPMLTGIELDGITVLEAMCGSGETTSYLLDRKANVIGLDVSASEIDKFLERWPNAKGECGSIFETSFEDNSIDCVVVVGGLHHLHPHLSDAIREIHRILVKGGYFCFAEPHQESFFDVIRRFWYRHDDLFADNEAAIDVLSLKAEFKDLFDQTFENYSGTVGYLFVLNSMVFRIPYSIKRLYSPFLLSLETYVNRFNSNRLSCMVTGQWVKK